MKTRMSDTAAKEIINSLLFLFTVIMLFTAGAFAADKPENNESSSKVSLNENALKTLIAGLESDNDGLRKCCVYFAGVYEIDAVVPTLVNMLSTEKNENIKILAAFALYRIGNNEALMALSTRLSSEMNPELQKISSEVSLLLAKNPSEGINFSTK